MKKNLLFLLSFITSVLLFNPSISLASTDTISPTTTVSPTITTTTPLKPFCGPSNGSYPSPNLYIYNFSWGPNVTNHGGYYYSYYGYSYDSCRTNLFLRLEIRDNFQTISQSNSYFGIYAPLNISNCWEVRPVWEGYTSPWSNKVCYEYVPPTTTTTTTTTTTVPKVVTSSNTSYYFSTPKAAPKPKTKKVKVKQTTFYRTGAICRDGWKSSATGAGACSHHGGVYKWLGINKTTWTIKNVPIIPKAPKSSSNCYLCYSNTTGLPKTNYVNGYFRSDGTYVNGYWRSK